MVGAGETIEVFLNDLKEKVAKRMAQTIADELTAECRSAIQDFYDQYDPEDLTLHNGRIYYYRHWNFKKSFKRSYRKNGSAYIGGVILLFDELPDVYKGKNSSPVDVFNRVYLGYHGIASFQNRGVPIMRPSPYGRIRNRQKYIVQNIQKYANNALREVI